MFERQVEEQINGYIDSKEKKILFLWGPRRSGKTTLLKKIAARIGETIYNFDFLDDRDFFINDKKHLEELSKKHKVILIDEVQNYPESTIVLKLLHDEFGVKIIATGSSELRQKSSEFDTLAGRYIEVFCLPFSNKELLAKDKNLSTNDLRRQLSDTIKWGSYPEVRIIKEENQKIYLLENIYNTYVLKDVVNIYNLKDTKLAKDILTKIALQVGSEVSLREIANSLNANVGTVSSYVEIFVRNYILIALNSFRTNIRRAVSENKKYYFLDLGIRNSLVKDFRDLELRQDSGQIFENLIVSEVYKHLKNNRLHRNMYFYREYSGKEVDLVLESYKKEYSVFEIKLNKEKTENVFPIESRFDCINQNNYFEIIDNII